MRQCFVLILFFSLFLLSPLLFMGVFHSRWSNEGLLKGRGKGTEERHSFHLALEILKHLSLFLFDLNRLIYVLLFY